MPTAGPIERVEGQSETCQNCINVEVAPPHPATSPRGGAKFLTATSNYQPGYATTVPTSMADADDGGGCDDLHRRAARRAEESISARPVGKVERTAHAATDKPYAVDFN